jgi:hypothetical protein
MLFHGGHQDFLRHLQIPRLEGSDNGIGAFGRIDRLIEQVGVEVQSETGLLANLSNLIFDHTLTVLRIHNDTLTFKPLQIRLGVSNRNPLRTP